MTIDLMTSGDIELATQLTILASHLVYINDEKVKFNQEHREHVYAIVSAILRGYGKYYSKISEKYSEIVSLLENGEKSSEEIKQDSEFKDVIDDFQALISHVGYHYKYYCKKYKKFRKKMNFSKYIDDTLTPIIKEELIEYLGKWNEKFLDNSTKVKEYIILLKNNFF